MKFFTRGWRWMKLRGDGTVQGIESGCSCFGSHFDFFNLFDQRYDDLCLPTLGIKEDQRKKEKQALVQWMKTIKNLRDPLSHPSEEDFSFEESFDLLYCARRVLLRLQLKPEADQIKDLMDALSGRPRSIGK